MAFLCMSVFLLSTEVTTDNCILEPEETLRLPAIYTLHLINEEIDTHIS